MRQVKCGSRRLRSNRFAFAIEGLESRFLLSVNAWKLGTSGNWNDPTKWSLGHIPTTTEDVTITVAGNYTVTVPTSAATPFYYLNSLAMGTNTTGTQKLEVNAYMIIAKAFNVGAGDTIDIAGGRFNAGTPAGTNCQIDGTIMLSGSSAGTSYLSTGAANMLGAGSIVGATAAVNGTSDNLVTSNGSTLGSSMTLRGKSAQFQGAFTSKGAIKLEGTTTDSWSFGFLNNQGSFVSPGGSNITIYNLVNAAGKTISVTGGSLVLKGTYSNAGTITASSAKLTYGMTFTAAGTVNRTNSPVYFSGFLNANGGTLTPGDSAGGWTWTTGQLQNGSYDPSAATALKVDLTAPSSNYGALNKVTLIGDLNIPAGFYVNSTNGTTLTTGHRILLNGNTTKGRAAFYTNGGTLGGNGEVVFNTAGNNPAVNLLSGTSWTLGSGVLVHGKSGQVANGLTNAGIIMADSAGETIQIADVINNGSIIAAPGTISIMKFTQNSSGALTIGIGGTSAGSSYGQFKFTDTANAPALNGLFNAVTLNGYAPAVGATFNVASFAKAPTGAFSTANLDAGSGKAFDLTQTATSLSIKAKAATGTFATRASSGALTITGTSLADTITTKQQLGVLYATMNGKTSVFLDLQITSESINAGAGSDTVTITGGRGVKISGGDGNDSLTGGTGPDSLDGGEGSDLLAGRAGNDVYIFATALIAQTDIVAETAGSGTDTLDFSALSASVTVNLASDTALATMANRTVKTQTTGQFANFENATGGSGNDSLSGNTGANRLVGGAGNDVLSGGDGNDSLYGGIGNDKLTGGNGLDSLYGEAGNDTLYGADSGAKDLLDGGADADVLGSSDAVDTIVSIP